MKQFLVRRWFLLALLTILLVGLSWPQALHPYTQQVPRAPIVIAALFFMALPLEISTMWRVFRYPGPAFLAIGINFGLVPPLAWGVSQFFPEDLAIGLVIMAAAPCTMASAAVWTRRAGGNDAVAILVTMITNIACFVVTPLWLEILTSVEAEAKPLGELVVRLAVLVVLPIVAGQLLRMQRSVATWASRNKRLLGVLAQMGILMMVTIGVVDSGKRLFYGEQSGEISLLVWIGMFLAVNVIHVVALWLGLILAQLLRMSRGDQIAVGFAGSQKTLMVGLEIGLQYGGLTVLPMVAYHICQLLVDTVVADSQAQAAGEEPVD